MASAHPTSELIAAYAAGTLSDGLSLVVASHLTYCPTCRSAARDFEAVGGTMLRKAPEAELSSSALDAVFAMIDGDTATEVAAPYRDSGESPLPRPIQDVVGQPFDEMAWQFRLPGLHEYKLDGFEDEDVSLLRARPGAGMLAHTHRGEEATLMLTGMMQDGETVLAKGDLNIADHSHDHSPRIIGEETCYCLIVMSGGMRFTGPFSRALNLFTR